MSETFHAYAALKSGGKLEPFEFDPGPLLPDQVQIKVESCGICHSDLSMIDNEWGMSAYPLVAGHEAIGVVEKAGDQVKGIELGQRVGLGWFSRSCMSCQPCLSGKQNLCANDPEATIVGRHGAFADRVRGHWSWVTPLPGDVEASSAGPLFCGGATVFGPIEHYGVKPTDRVGVVGIGGLGHLALQFLNKWGCHVTAFSSSESKGEEAKTMGAHAVVDSTDGAAMKKVAGSFDFIINTANATLDWNAYISALKADGRLHFVGVTPEPVSAEVFSLISARRSISGSPLASPAEVRTMLEFCGRHGIKPITERFRFSEINEAIEHLRAGKARYRVVLAG